MGGDQDGFRRGQHIPECSHQPQSDYPSKPTVKLGENPVSLTREQSDRHTSPNGSYFSTLELPQSFSFVQSLQGRNASFSADTQLRSHDRSLSSPVVGQQGLPLNSLSSIHDIPSCSSRLTQTDTSQEMSGASSLTKPRRTRMRAQQSNNSSSQKRQKYLEKRRKIEQCPSLMPLGKRRSYSDDEDEGISMQPIRKVFINEDKMAARFDGLSLSHRLRSPAADARRIMADIDSRLMDSDDEDEAEVRSKVNSRGQRLEMSHSFKTALQKSSTKVLPDKIAQKIVNPCTAMILWQPSANDVVLRVEKDPDETNQSQRMDDDSVERPLLSRLLSDVPDPDENMDL